MSICNICAVEAKIFVKCFCEFEACQVCAKRYILELDKEAACMSCNKQWSRRFLHSQFPSSFVAKEYKNHLERVLYERELGMLQATQEHVEKEIQNRKRKEQLLDINEKLRQLNILKSELVDPQRVLNNAPKKIFTMRCPKDCLGFVGTDFKCGVCETDVCRKCKEVRDSDHVCNPDILSNVQALAKDTKPCPKCAAMIFKISGCDQMYCVECHTAFSWRTLEIETRVMHNPHYFEYLKTQGTAPGPRNVDPCRIRRGDVFGALRGSQAADLVMHVNHVREVTRFKYAPSDMLELNLADRVKLILKEITPERFKARVQMRDKAERKKAEIRDVISLYTTTMDTNLIRLARKEITNEVFWTETKALRRYTDDQFSIIAQSYGSKKVTLF